MVEERLLRLWGKELLRWVKAIVYPITGDELRRLGVE
jgi:hypothetical protein